MGSFDPECGEGVCDEVMDRRETQLVPFASCLAEASCLDLSRFLGWLSSPPPGFKILSREMGDADGGTKKRVRLNTSQLYDLYSRLDINGDGELDMGEFMDVGKKLDFEDENMVVRAFRHADTSASGKLDAEEFLAAYDALFSGDLQAGGESDESFVRATR